MDGLSHEERFQRLGLYPLEFKGVIDDLIETYKILKSLYRVDLERIFPPAGESRIRDHSLKMSACSFQTEIRRN